MCRGLQKEGLMGVTALPYLYSDLCRVLHSHRCVHYCRPAFAASIPVLHAACATALGRVSSLPCPALCSTGCVGCRPGPGNGRGGEFSLDPAAVRSAGLACPGERVWDDGLPITTKAWLHVCMPGAQTRFMIGSTCKHASTPIYMTSTDTNRF